MAKEAFRLDPNRISQLMWKLILAYFGVVLIGKFVVFIVRGLSTSVLATEETSG